MKARKRAGVVALMAVAATTGAAGAASASTTGASGSGVTVVTQGLEGPFGLQSTRAGGFVVADSGSGDVRSVDRHGHQKVLLEGVPGVAGVAARSGRTYAVLGGPNEDGSPAQGDYKPSSVLRMRGDRVHVLANLLTYELAHNPDGQRQFNAKGQPYDALSNPFAMTSDATGLIVADAGANDVLRVNPRSGHVSTFFVPPTVTGVKACLAPGAQANPGTVGCDPVPTGVAASRGSVYVSTLGAEVPGAGRVYRLDERTGKVQQVWRGLTAPTGVAVSPSGAVYVSEVEYGAPQGEPPADFDPSSIGRITRITSHGRTHAQVTMPTGLVFTRGHLYASAWSIAGFLGIPNAGQVVRVADRAFH